MHSHPVTLRTLTEADAPALDRELADLRPAADPDLVLDLSAVEFLASMALARFVALDRELRAAGGRLTLVNVRPAVRRVFAVTRLDTLLVVRVAEPPRGPRLPAAGDSSTGPLRSREVSARVACASCRDDLGAGRPAPYGLCPVCFGLLEAELTAEAERVSPPGRAGAETGGVEPVPDLASDQAPGAHVPW